MDDDDFKKWQRDYREHEARQGHERDERIAKYRRDIAELRKEKEQTIQRIGKETNNISILFSKRERELTEERDRDIDDMQLRHWKEDELFINPASNHENLQEPQQELEPDTEPQAVTHEPAEPQKIDAERNPKLYSELIEKLNNEREERFTEFYKDLIELYDARSNGLNEDIYQYEKEKLRHSIHSLGIAHYSQLIDHIENPQFHEELRKWEDNERDKQADINRQKELDRAEKLREEAEKNLLDQFNREQRFAMFNKMRQEYTQSREHERDLERER